DPVGPGADLIGILAPGATVAEQVPAGALLADVGRGPPLVLAIIPFEQVGLRLGPVAKAGQFAGAPGALGRAAKDPVGREALEPFAEALRIALAARGEGDIGAAGVLSGDRPFGLAVTSEVDLGQRLGHRVGTPGTSPAHSGTPANRRHRRQSLAGGQPA